MISEKMIKLTRSNSTIRAMFEEGNRLAALYGRENVFDFSLGNPNIPAPSAVNDAIMDIVQNENPMALHGYMSNAGYPSVRKAIADSLNTRFETSFDDKNIIMSVGAAGGLNVVLKTLLNPGNEVIAISPFFVEYGNYVNNYDGNLVIIPAARFDFQPDPETLRAAITPRTKAVIINSPNNPTGVVYTEDTIKQLAAVLDEKNIIMSVGAAGGLNVVLKTLLNPGNEVIAISPFFVEYGNYVNNYDGNLVIIPAARFDFQPDSETLRAAITPRTKAVIINSPNNPTGVVYTEDTIKQLAAVLEEKSQEYGAPIYIISDEPYRELVYDDITVPFITKYYKDTIICYSWSKSLSLPGQRIGYIVLPNELEEFELIFDAASIATRILGYVNAPALMQRVVEKCLFEQTNIGAYDTNRKMLYNGLQEFGIDSIYPQGAFYLWVKTPGGDKEFVEAAKKYNILLVPGSAFTCPGYVRIAYCVAGETIERSLPAFKKLAEELK